MNIPKNHCSNACITDCSCDACVYVRLLVAEVAERVGKIAVFDPGEIQERLEPTIWVVANNGAAIVQIVRQDGTPALKAPLENEANIKGIIRTRVNDLRLSIAARNENRKRLSFFEDSVAERVGPDEAHDDEVLRLALHEFLEMNVGSLCEAILRLRLKDGCSRKEVEELLGLSTKQVRNYERHSLELLFSRSQNHGIAKRQIEELFAYLS